MQKQESSEQEYTESLERSRKAAIHKMVRRDHEK
jgi:uncharacterized protein YbjQ (UPF0145 family)